jgi:hypothetical protein
VVQFTREGLGDWQFGMNTTSAAPGSARALRLIVLGVAAAVGAHENGVGVADLDWPGRYGAYLAADQAGTELPR